MTMNNEIKKIRNAKAAGPSAVFQLVKATEIFTYSRGYVTPAEYSLEGCMIAHVVRELCDTFHADIAAKINHGEKISDKQAYAVAAKFCELDFTFGQFRSANAHLFED